MSLENSHILICRTDHIGDVVLTLPLAGYLKRRYPASKISFLCRAYTAPFVRLCGAVDEVIEVERLGDPVSQLAQLKIDTILFCKPDKHLAAAAKKARIPNRVGTSHRLFHWLYCNRLAHFSRVKSPLHEAQLNFELLRPLGLGIETIPALEAIPALYQLTPPAWSDRLSNRIGLSPECFNLIIHPKSNGNGREWPIASYTELARQLQPEQHIQLWVTGSANEGQWLEQHAPELLRLPNVNNVCGQFTLDELAVFIHAADGLIASGTGPLHMSAALGKPTLGLFPPIRPIHPGRWGPVGVNAQVLCVEKTCAGCNNAETCTCMRNILPEQVIEQIEYWMRVRNQVWDRARIFVNDLL